MVETNLVGGGGVQTHASGFLGAPISNILPHFQTACLTEASGRTRKLWSVLIGEGQAFRKWVVVPDI